MNRSLRLYIVGVSVAFWSGLAFAYLTGNAHTVAHPAEVGPLFGIAVAAEALVVYRRQKAGNDTFSFSAIAHVGIAILFGPTAAAIVAAAAVTIVDGMRLADRDVILMNSSLFGIAAWLSGWAFVLAGGTVGSVSVQDAVPILVLIAVRFVSNEVILSGAVALSREQAFLRVLRDDLRATFAGTLGESSLGVLVAFGYASDRWIVIPFLVPLLAALYQSQSNLERLRNETDDALNAFAGVIDERDPSTAEHSSRVAHLVERFVEAIGLPDREAERLVAAARFHDLGKVAVDVATLSKEGRLTDEELRSIRSHPRLSAQLLSPFGFAQEMALYAELHHERYDGSGYYSVSQREIPIEAHVLIAADSFDAMTSARAYRPALTLAEAVQEIRDKAGSQFHPLVAQAFTSMLEGQDVERALGHSQMEALRSEFSAIPLVRLPNVSGLLRAEPAAIYLAAVTVAAFGISVIPRSVVAGLAFLTVLGVAARISRGARHVRIRAQVLAGCQAGASPTEVLRDAGIARWTAWVTWDDERREYEVTLDEHAAGPGDIELREIANRAMRPGTAVLSGSLSSGMHLTMTPPDRKHPRLAAGSDRPLSAFECELVEEVCRRTAGRIGVVQHPDLQALPGDQRAAEGDSLAIISVELATFENVRVVAGQLSAERVVQDAILRCRRLLRGEDEVVQVGEDRIVLAVRVPDLERLALVCGRVADALRNLPVPHRAESVAPEIRSAIAPFAGDPELGELATRLGLYGTQERRAS